MNKTAAFITYGVLAGLGIIGLIVLSVAGIADKQYYVTTVITVLGLASVAAGTFHNLGRQDYKIEQVKRNTNGTLSALLTELARKEKTILKMTEKLAEIEKDENNGK